MHYRLVGPYFYIPSVFSPKFPGMLCDLFFRRLVIRKGASLGVLPQFRTSLCPCSKLSNITIAQLHFCDSRFFDCYRYRVCAYDCTTDR